MAEDQPGGRRSAYRACRLENGTVLLCNPDWGYSLALTAEAIDLQRRQGKLAVLSNRAIFDEAADRAFRQLSAAT